MGYFDIDYDKNVWENIPSNERTPVRYAWLKSLIKPLRYIYALFSGNRANNLYLLAHNGQVCYMEAVLNDTFDNGLRRIFISDPAYCDPVWLFTDAENSPVYIDLDSEVGTGVISGDDPVPLFLDSEVVGVTDMFIIHVPTALALNASQINRMKALINLYRLPGRTNYSIVNF